MSGTDKKREEFLSGEARYRGPNRVIFLVFGLVAVVGIAWFVLATRNTAEVPRRWEGGNYNVGRTFNYKNQVISMTDIENKTENGKILISLDQVIESKIIYTETKYELNGVPKALTAMVTPAGRLIVALAMCEPCRSQRFHIDDNILVCDTCGTRWLLNDLRGLSGGCPEYPPEELPYEVKDGTIYVPEGIVRDWQPRI